MEPEAKRAKAEPDIKHEFWLQNTRVESDGSLQPVKHILLGMVDGIPRVSCDGCRWHGTWNELHDGWYLEFNFKADGVVKRLRFHRIPRTDVFLQTNCGPPFQNVLCPPGAAPWTVLDADM